MPRRIEIELTSAQADGTWTWRAAGALKPRGVLDGSLLYDQAKAGDVVKAEADFEIEGITIVSVHPPQVKKRSEPQRIEVIGPSRADTPGVTTQLFGKSERRAGDRSRGDGPRERQSAGPRPDGGRSDRPRRDGPAQRTPGGDAAARTDRPKRDGPGRSVPSGDTRGPDGPRRDRSSGSERALRRPAPPDERGETSRGRRPERPRISPSDTGGSPTAESGRPRPRRLNPANVHRQAAMDSLAPEEQAVADQVLRGGIPAVRTAIHLEREKAESEGRPAPNAESLLTLAEQLLPRLKAADWLDRAQAAAKAVDEISLRDLRSVVAGADVARDDETRELATTLREALDRRVTAQTVSWTDEIVAHLTEGRLVRALRLAGRPPEVSARLAPEIADQLSEAAGTAMAPDTAPERWAALLDAVAASPVRRNVKPVGLPAQPGAELLRAAHQQAGRVPALVAMLGITIPPPPGPLRPVGAPGPRLARPGSSPRRPRRAPPARLKAPDTDATVASEASAPPIQGPPPADITPVPPTESTLAPVPSEMVSLDPAEGVSAGPDETVTVPDVVAPVVAGDDPAGAGTS